MATNSKKGGTKKPKSGATTSSKSASKNLDSPKKDEELFKKVSSKKPLFETAATKSKAVAVVPSKKTGVDSARKNRLKKAGIEITVCPVTNMPLDVGPRANKWLVPTEFEGKIVSWLARVILSSKITADELDKTADNLRKL